MLSVSEASSTPCKRLPVYRRRSFIPFRMTMGLKKIDQLFQRHQDDNRVKKDQPTVPAPSHAILLSIPLNFLWGDILTRLWHLQPWHGK